MHGIAEVLTYWWSEESRRHWFAPTPEFDQEIRERFADRSARAATGELSAWEETPDGCLALCVLLDQMPRNMFRGTPRVYATDRKALEVAKRAVSRGSDRGLPPEQKQFLYLPFSHSERLADQARALALFVSRPGRGPGLRAGPSGDHPPVRAISPSQRHLGAVEHARGAGVSGAGPRELWPKRRAIRPAGRTVRPRSRRPGSAAKAVADR